MHHTDPVVNASTFKHGGDGDHTRGTYPEDANDNKENNFEKMPLAIIRDLEEHKLSCSKRVHSL